MMGMLNASSQGKVLMDFIPVCPISDDEGTIDQIDINSIDRPTSLDGETQNRQEEFNRIQKRMQEYYSEVISDAKGMYDTTHELPTANGTMLKATLKQMKCVEKTFKESDHYKLKKKFKELIRLLEKSQDAKFYSVDDSMAYIASLFKLEVRIFEMELPGKYNMLYTVAGSIWKQQYPNSAIQPLHKVSEYKTNYGPTCPAVDNSYINEVLNFVLGESQEPPFKAAAHLYHASRQYTQYVEPKIIIPNPNERNSLTKNALIVWRLFGGNLRANSFSWVVKQSVTMHSASVSIKFVR